MADSYNGMPASELGDVSWLKSVHSNPNGACVEVALLADGEVAFRNSRFPDGPALVYTRAEITAFLAGAKDGEFDHVLNLHIVNQQCRRPLPTGRWSPVTLGPCKRVLNRHGNPFPRKLLTWETNACPAL
jgi:hypothetical protein